MKYSVFTTMSRIIIIMIIIIIIIIIIMELIIKLNFGLKGLGLQETKNLFTIHRYN